MLDKLTSADFESLLNQTFQIELQSGEQFTAELIEVSEMGQAPSEDNDLKRRAFSTILRIQGDMFFPQQICSVAHESMEKMALFLVPLGPDKVGMRYEAMFT